MPDTLPTHLFRLRASGRQLYTESGQIVLCVYPEGDCDSIPWPMPKKAHKNLTSALFDMRETGELPADTRSVLLPDGTLFHIDSSTITQA